VQLLKKTLLNRVHHGFPPSFVFLFHFSYHLLSSLRSGAGKCQYQAVLIIGSLRGVVSWELLRYGIKK